MFSRSDIALAVDELHTTKPLEASLDGETFAYLVVLAEIRGLNHCLDARPLEVTCTRRGVDWSELIGSIGYSWTLRGLIRTHTIGQKFKP